jgi:Type VI secretion system/phage-baseplate injector OB domain
MTSTFLPAAGNPQQPQWNNLYQAVVANNSDPLGEQRVQLYIPQVLASTLSNWAVPLAPGAAPQVGQTVFAMFVGGNPNYPVYSPAITPGSQGIPNYQFSDEGFFIYNGVPAFGNLIASFASPATTEDPYTNPVSTILYIGQEGNAGFQVDNQGNVWLTNPSGVPTMFISPESEFMGWYPLGTASVPQITIASQAATDTVTGATYPAGIAVGLPTDNQIEVTPDLEQPFYQTNTLYENIQAAVQLDTVDTNQAITGMVAPLVLGTKMATLISSPFGTTGAAILLEAENDAGSDTASVNLGTVSTPDGETLNFNPLLFMAPYSFVLYDTVAAQGATTYTSGTGHWTCPAGVTSVSVQCWGGGGGALNYAGGYTPGGRGGGGGGEYAEELTLAVTPGNNYAYTVGAAGTGGTTGSAGGTTTFAGDSVTVTAHGGAGSGSAESPGNGGSGSTNSTHYPGGNGGAGNETSGTKSVTHTESWNAVHTYAYEGENTDSDPAPGYSPGARLNVDGAVTQGDDQLGDNGNTSTIILLPWSDIQSAMAGYTSINYAQFYLNNTHTWYGSGATVNFGWSDFGGTFGTIRNLAGWSVTENKYSASIAEGASKTFSFPSSFFSALANNASAILLYNPSSTRNSYAQFTGGSNPKLTMQWVTGGTTTTGGGGGGGGSGKSTAAGSAGAAGTSTSGGTGGAGTGKGGNGGNNDASGASGAAPGGGGGGGGYGSASGGSGGAGKIIISYTGTASAGVLASISSTSGIDTYGTAYPAGTRLPGATGGMGGPGPIISYLTSNAAQCTSTAQTPTGLSGPVISGASYFWEADVFVDAQSTNAMYITMGGPTVSSFLADINYGQMPAAVADDSNSIVKQQTTIGNNAAMNSANMTSGQIYLVQIKGFATFTAAGNLTVGQASSANSASFTVLSGSVMKLYPV